MDEINDEWPVYSLRGNRDMWLLFVGNDWLIQSTKDKRDPAKALVRMSCASHCFPELRTDGNNGIIQYNEFMGRFTPVMMQKRSQIGIVTEAELGGSRASEMFKIAERGIGDAVDEASSSITEVDRSSLMVRRSSLSIRGIVGDGREDASSPNQNPGAATSAQSLPLGRLQRRNTIL